MRPTRWPVLVLVALVAGVLGYLLDRALYNDTAVLVAGYAPATLLLLAIAEAFLARSTRARLAGRPHTRPIHPITVARTAALAKASSPVGALGVGWYAALLAYVVPRLDAPRPAHDARVAIAGIVTGLMLVVAALLLERVCRVPKRPDGDKEPEEPEHDVHH